jgi:hypothetical protein
MQRWQIRQFVQWNADSILERLMRSQWLRPHAKVGQVLDELAGELGFDPATLHRTASRLDGVGAVAIGRLRRTELTQLARALYRSRRGSAVSAPAC